MKPLNFLICFLFSASVIAQDYDFGKVSKEELQEKVCSIDSSAHASVLYQYRNTYFSSNAEGLALQTEITKRIKIYDKEGFDSATEIISLFEAGSANESIGKIKAITYNLENNKIVKTELSKDQIFKDKVTYSYKQIKFTMPNVKAGSVIEIKYRKTSPFITNIDEFVFQRDIPIKKLFARIKSPDGLIFNKTSKGYLTSFYPKRSSEFSNSYNMKMNIETYNLNNIPALKEENYVDNIENYRAGIMFELVSVQIPGMIHRNYAQSWSEVARTIGSTDDYKNKLDKTKSFDDILDDLIIDVKNNESKMKIIFKYVKDNIKWNGIDGKSFYNGIRKSLKEKTGNVADINLTLVAMLRYAGIDANPVIISTKDNVVPYFPTVNRLNYVVAYAVINETKYFLDATDEFSDINVLPVKDYNWKGILIDNPKSMWKKIDISEPELTIDNYSIEASLKEDGSLQGNFDSKYSKHKALQFRKKYKENELDAFVSSREKEFGNIEISEYKVENTNSYEGFVNESFHFSQSDMADIVSDKIYFSPFLFLKTEENPFKLEERLFPVDFGYPFLDRYIINIDIPEGFTVESIPESVIMKIPNNLGEFKFYPSFVGNKLKLMVNLKINKAIINSKNYLFLKEFFNQVVSKENEQIVLTRI